MNVGEMQRKLSSWAERDKKHRFFDLYHLLYDQDWLRLAHDYVAQNAGSRTAGCDGINMRIFDERLEEHLQQLAQEIKSETFKPQPVRRVHIPKANGKYRSLGISTIKDRIVQEALRMILEPIYEADFSQYSYGFRPNRRTMDAISCIQKWTHGQSKYYWIIEGDLTSYFDTIHHRRLVKILRRRIKDERIIRLIWKFLRAGVMEEKLFKETTCGVPQGASLVRSSRTYTWIN
jgi:group II intron reverse transcriptase/maturase